MVLTTIDTGDQHGVSVCGARVCDSTHYEFTTNTRRARMRTAGGTLHCPFVGTWLEFVSQPTFLILNGNMQISRGRCRLRSMPMPLCHLGARTALRPFLVLHRRCPAGVAKCTEGPLALVLFWECPCEEGARRHAATQLCPNELSLGCSRCPVRLRTSGLW